MGKKNEKKYEEMESAESQRKERNDEEMSMKDAKFCKDDERLDAVQ